MGYTEITIWLVSHTTTHTGFNINVREGMHICCNEYKSNHYVWLACKVLRQFWYTIRVIGLLLLFWFPAIERMLCHT